MSEYSSEVIDFTERSGDYFTGTPARTLGSIVVKPPLQAGELFKGAVLGREGFLVDVHHIVTNNETTVFLAESGRGELEDRKSDIITIADRIGQLANTPETVVQMIDSNPFPQPQPR